MNPNESLKKVVKNFKLLLYFMIFFMILAIATTFKQIIDTTDFTKFTLNGMWSFSVTSLCFGITGYIVYNLIKLLNAFGNKETFIQNNSHYLIKISNAFIGFAVIESIWNHKSNPIQILSNEHYGLSFGVVTALLLCMSFFSKLFSLILLTAIEIKEDSDLTI